LLSIDDWNLLLAGASSKTYQKDEVIIGENEPAASIVTEEYVFVSSTIRKTILFL
jgi:hypothetical protein